METTQKFRIIEKIKQSTEVITPTKQTEIEPRVWAVGHYIGWQMEVTILKNIFLDSVAFETYMSGKNLRFFDPKLSLTYIWKRKESKRHL